jgi:hypothetical protein
MGVKGWSPDSSDLVGLWEVVRERQAWRTEMPSSVGGGGKARGGQENVRSQLGSWEGDHLRGFPRISLGPHSLSTANETQRYAL